MSSFLLIDHMQVQDVNAIAGFTWGFPSITHFLGFVHLLQRKLDKHAEYSSVKLGGCAVVAHEHQARTYGAGSTIAFTQSRNPPYLDSHAKDSTPPVIEEGKMSMTVSLLIEVQGSLEQYGQVFLDWVSEQSYMQRLAGGSVFGTKSVTGFSIKPGEQSSIRALQRMLLPGFSLLNRCDLLQEHYVHMQRKDPSAEVFDAWLDFIALKRQARPAHDLIERHLKNMPEETGLYEAWQLLLEQSYDSKKLPPKLTDYFDNLTKDKPYKSLINQWKQYITPTERTAANWEYAPKPASGYLVPIMCGYKAISDVMSNDEVSGTRDGETDVCFVEAAHSVGEWRSVHRMRDLEDIHEALWHYNDSPDWYLCSNRHDFKSKENAAQISEEMLNQDPNLF